MVGRNQKFKITKTRFLIVAWLFVAISLFSMMDEILQPRSHVVEYIGGRTRDATLHDGEFIVGSGSYYLVFDSTEDSAVSSTTIEGTISTRWGPTSGANVKVLNEILAVDSKFFYPITAPQGVNNYYINLVIRTSNPVSSYIIDADDREYLEINDDTFIIQNILILVFSVLSFYMGYILLIFVSKTTNKKIPWIPLKIEKIQKQRYIPKSEYYTLMRDLEFDEDILIASKCDLYQIESSELIDATTPLASISLDTNWKPFSEGILILTNKRLELVRSKHVFSLPLRAIEEFDVFQAPNLELGLLIKKRGESTELFIVNDALQWKDFISTPEPKVTGLLDVVTTMVFCIACGTDNEITQDICNNCGDQLLKN